MRVSVDQSIPPSETYASARTRSLYNVGAEDGARFRLEAEIPTGSEGEWQIGVVVGPSGSGKSSILRALAERGWIEFEAYWPEGSPVIDVLSDQGDYAKATASLGAVGLGSVPSWLRPRSVLSMGEGFRADLAQLLLSGPRLALVDEWTSVLDRQVAKVASGAFAKSWRRVAGRQCVLFTPHYDVLDWLEPDWYLDTAEAGGGSLPGEEVKVIAARSGGSFREAKAAARDRGVVVASLVV